MMRLQFGHVYSGRFALEVTATKTLSAIQGRESHALFPLLLVPRFLEVDPLSIQRDFSSENRGTIRNVFWNPREPVKAPLGVPGTKLRLAIPKGARAVFEVDALSSTKCGNPVLGYFARAGTGQSTFPPLHESGFGRFCRNPLNPNKVSCGLHDFIKIDIGLFITPGVVDNLSGFDGVRLAALQLALCFIPIACI